MFRIAFVFLLLMISSVAHAEKRVALVIGNSAYKHAGELANPKNDAIDTAGALKTLRFQVIEGYDLDKASLDRKIRDFAGALQGADVGLFFYAGHGLQVAGQNYIVPVDAELATTASLDFEMVRLDLVHRTMEREAATNIIFLDACRNNPLARNLARALGTRSTDVGRGLAAVESGSGTLISFSTQPGNVASDGSGRNSPFTGPLVKHITSSSDDLGAVLIAVRNDVMNATQKKQVPWEHSALTKRIYFNAAPAAATSATGSLSEAERTWAVVKDTTNQSVLEAFARQFSDTVYGAMARAQLEELKKQQVAVATPPSRPESKPAPQAKPAVSTTPQVPMPQPSLSGILKVGLAGPLTGPHAAFGVQLKNGAEQGVADINAMGGINGQKIRLVFGDDASDPRQGVSVANKMRDEGVKFVIGHFNSAVTMAASEVYQESGTYLITPSATNPKITERGMWNVFRTSGRDDQQSEVAAAYILSKFNGKKIAIAHDKTIYGQGLAEATKKAMVNGGMQEVLYEGINKGEKDYSVLIAKIKGSGADLVYWGGLYPEGGLIVKQMREQGVKAKFMGSDGLATDEFPAIGGAGVEGTLMTFNADPRKNPAAAKIVRTFAAKNIKPEAYTLYSYAALQVIALAAADSGSLDPRKVAEATKSGKAFKTVIGDLVYDRKGDITRPDYVMYVWRKGANGKITFTEE